MECTAFCSEEVFRLQKERFFCQAYKKEVVQRFESCNFCMKYGFKHVGL